MCIGPSTPAAPGLFSMVIDWPRCFSVVGASVKKKTSVVPPGGHGTMKVTGRVGKFCAGAVPSDVVHAASATQTAMMVLRRIPFLPRLRQTVGYSHAPRDDSACTAGRS